MTLMQNMKRPNGHPYRDGEAIMVEYLKEILGINIRLMLWDSTSKLPIGLSCKSEYFVMEYEDVQMIVVKIPQTDIQKKRLQSYYTAVRKICGFPVVFWLDAVSTYQRKMLISGKIAFIVPGSQCFLPFLGMSFRERMSSVTGHITSFSATAQILVLYALYHPEKKEISQAGVAEKINCSPMAVSRGIRELESLGFIDVEIRGRRRFVHFKNGGNALYDSAKDYMTSPVYSKHFVIRDRDKDTALMIAGESALARKTMLNPPKIDCFAVNKETWGKLSDRETDADWYTGEMDLIEVWKYDPALFGQNGAVDLISLIHSFDDNQDERIEGQISELMEGEKWYMV